MTTYGDLEVGEGTENLDDGSTKDYFFIQRPIKEGHEQVGWQEAFLDAEDNLFWRTEADGPEIIDCSVEFPVEYESRIDAEQFIQIYNFGKATFGENFVQSIRNQG